MLLNFYLGQLGLSKLLLFEVGSDRSDMMEVTTFCCGFCYFFPPFDNSSEAAPLSFPFVFQNFSKKNQNKLQLVGDFNKDERSH